MSLLLCLVIFTGAVACSGEKGASGQKVVGQEVQQGKPVVTDGKHREKPGSSQQPVSERVVVENNALGDIIENQASGMSQEEKYQKAQNALVKATEEFKAKNCAGLSAEACGAKMEAHRDALLKSFADAGLDFVPVVGTIKTLVEAQSALDYLTVAASLIPGERVASAILKNAEKALAKGDVAEASRLINKASDEVYAAFPMGSKRNPMNQPSNPSYQPVRNQPATISNREYSGHALDRMQDRGIIPSVVENTIKNGKSTPSRDGTTVHFDPENKVSVVTNESGRVVTVKYGEK